MNPTTIALVNARFGLVLLTSGACLAALIFVDRWTSIQLSFPGFWYTSRNFHVVACAGCFWGGWWMHQRAKSGVFVDAAAARIFRSIRIYTKPACTLCDKAIELIRNYPIPLPEPELINILDDTELTEKYGESIPVVEIDGRVRFRGVISVALLDRLVTARQERMAQVASREKSESD